MSQKDSLRSYARARPLEPSSRGGKWYWARTRDKASHDPIPRPLSYRGHPVPLKTRHCGSCQSDRHCWRSTLQHASALIKRDFGSVLGVQQTKQLPHVAKVDLVWQLGV
ncbi:hypothetical protein TNCV_2206611 [Trichonephila clavipes]|uniref:Uncharacterized protein n=1 Tax=Trichonephila clavipes TaxID=2585209 RepID=A0A8X6S5W9_TRICX|nr:hypothetical protein TNCV_2206611 [Trichonephila clavipes]